MRIDIQEFVIIKLAFLRLPDCRFATACKGSNFFTRQERNEPFTAAYKEVPVITMTPRGLVNVKAVLYNSEHIRNIPSIVRRTARGPYQSFVYLRKHTVRRS